MSDDIRESQVASHTPEGNSASPVENNGADLSRRRFSKTGLLAAPAIYTLASKPAFGNHCSISGHLSGNLSQPNDHVCGGCTPGYWGQHPENWPNMSIDAYHPGSCGPVTTGHKTRPGRMVGNHCQDNSYNNDGTMFHDANYGFGGSLYQGESMMRVIHMAGNEDSYQLGAHAVAALLNSIRLGEEVYGMTPMQVVQLFNEHCLIDPEGLKNTFQMMNERNCPL